MNRPLGAVVWLAGRIDAQALYRRPRQGRPACRNGLPDMRRCDPTGQLSGRPIPSAIEPLDADAHWQGRAFAPESGPVGIFSRPKNRESSVFRFGAASIEECCIAESPLVRGVPDLLRGLSQHFPEKRLFGRSIGVDFEAGDHCPGDPVSIPREVIATAHFSERRINAELRIRPSDN